MLRYLAHACTRPNLRSKSPSLLLGTGGTRFVCSVICPFGSASFPCLALHRNDLTCLGCLCRHAAILLVPIVLRPHRQRLPPRPFSRPRTRPLCLLHKSFAIYSAERPHLQRHASFHTSHTVLSPTQRSKIHTPTPTSTPTHAPPAVVATTHVRGHALTASLQTTNRTHMSETCCTTTLPGCDATRTALGLPFVHQLLSSPTPRLALTKTVLNVPTPSSLS